MNKTSKSIGNSEKDAWVFAREQDTLTAYLRFLSRYPNSRHRQKALDRSEVLEEEKAWKAAHRSDRIYIYEKFLDDYPEGKYAKRAGKRILRLEKLLLKSGKEKKKQEKGSLPMEETALEEATNVDSIAAYNHFLKYFPHSSYAKQIQERMHQLESRLAVQYRFLEIELKQWELANQMNTPLSYRDFLRRFPDGKFASLAHQRLEEFGEKVNGRPTPNKAEPEKIRINLNSSPLSEVLFVHSKEKKLEEKSARSLAYIWLGLFIFNACIVYLLAPVFLHFVMALALLSAGYFMYSRNKELSNSELSIYGYGMCLAVWVSAQQILSFLAIGKALSWILASVIALIALLSLIKYVEGFSFNTQERDAN